METLRTSSNLILSIKLFPTSDVWFKRVQHQSEPSVLGRQTDGKWHSSRAPEYIGLLFDCGEIGPPDDLSGTKVVW
jgi:hypothetical protein